MKTNLFFAVCIIIFAAVCMLTACGSTSEADSDDTEYITAEDYGTEIPEGINELSNDTVTENIATAAVSMLEEGTDYKSLDGLMVTYGYVYYFDNRGIEALLKVTTDTTVAYFAVSANDLIRLNFTEDLFNAYTETFLDLHES